MTPPLVLGLDIGGTSSRAMLADLDGHRIGSGSAAGGNPTAHEVSQAFAAVEAALRAALATVDPARVAGAVVGMAGVGRLTESGVADQFEKMWHRVGLRCPYRAVPDAVVAFAAGTPAPHGTLLLAGTGAIAARIRDRQLGRICDGHGWLLGDLGSGFWLGREAVRATLAHLDGWTGLSALARRLLDDLLGTVPPPGRESVTAVVNAVRRDPPVALARFAPLVCQAAADGDGVARDIVERAAGHLLDSVAQIRAAETGPRAEAGPLVLAGSLLVADTPVSTAVRAGAALRWPTVTVTLAGDGAAGAAWLAARPLLAAATPATTLHARLVHPP
ncbi:MAG TPA: BadF/BadG/BcrA/BcrD ATPase family protein [Micromonosporaceae bacterium]